MLAAVRGRRPRRANEVISQDRHAHHERAAWTLPATHSEASQDHSGSWADPGPLLVAEQQL